jgi:acyl-CoA reductase-like NAD-dependent aldehyde dehydrogenase
MTDTIPYFDPRNGRRIGSGPHTPAEDVPHAAHRARKAFDTWGSLPPKERRPYLKRLRSVILQRGEEIAEMVATETGRPVAEAYAYDVLTTLVLIDYYQRHAHRMLNKERRSTWPFVAARGWVEYVPRGVTGVISPWNYPFFLPMISVVTALAAGCTVVLKPSEITPLTGQLIGDLVAEAGFPTDSVVVIHGGGETGSALLEAGIDVVAFTGSTKVGKKVAAKAAERLIPAILELGGKDAMIVLDDADVAKAARAAVWGAMFNTGQTCVSIERVLVQEDIYDEFVTQVTHLLDEIAERKVLGPIIHEPQLAVIEDHIDDAVAEGARILRGGHQLEADGGIFFEPTLLVDVDFSMKVIQDETFGPVLAVRKFDDEAEAIAMANASRYGLHGSVWSSNRKRAEQIASEMTTGTVAINDVAVNFITPSLPFGGIKESGLGTTFGADGLRAYTYPKGITEARTRWPTTQILGAWYPKPRGLRWWKAIARILFIK